MDTAMARMHGAMMISHSGDPDRDFARMMIPHHQGAIDMAVIELRYGKDERLRRLAQGIVVEQRQEIAVMRETLTDRPASPSRNKPDPFPKRGVHGDHQ
ncbi:CopM family metallochaperone [Sphingomonas sp. PB4P5]|uniref:CopM family metallochaperone n=1 Tax=Parasphingomonas puruogangriensis TaxID=3096155 RepID=UPI003FA7E83E